VKAREVALLIWMKEDFVYGAREQRKCVGAAVVIRFEKVMWIAGAQEHAA
jgi:hypothetical protein